jgi:hypothetical protein
MNPVLSRFCLSIIYAFAGAFGWELFISKAGPLKFFSWEHRVWNGGLDHEFWGLGLYVIASRDRVIPIRQYPEEVSPGISDVN